MDSEPIVRVANVHKFFRRGSEQIDVLLDLSLDVPEGEFLALMGPSGSGKTTLLNLIAGLDRPSQGTIEVGNDTISQMSEASLAKWRTRNVGFVFQFYNLLPVLTAYENVELPLLLVPMTKAERRRQVTNTLDLVGLANRMRHRPGQLSGGQQQRVGIARAIVTDPTLIVADEPTGDLDSKSAHEILDLMIELKNSLTKTILMVTHDPKAAARAERILHLEKGQLVSETIPDDIAPASLPLHAHSSAGRRAMKEIDEALLHFMDDWRNPVGVAVTAIILFTALLYWEQSRFIARSLRRNLLRSTLTGLATFVLVLIITLAWSVLALLDKAMESKSQNLKALVTEKYENPSQMPWVYAETISEGAPSTKGDYRVDPKKDAMAWSFYLGTLEPGKLSRESILFFFAMDPHNVLSIDAHGKYSSMMDDIEELSESEKRDLLAAVKDMEQNPYKVIMGKGRMAAIKKKVGEKIKVNSLNYHGLDLEFEICGELPGDRYDENAVMNYAYLDGAIQAYNKGKSKDQLHPMTDKSLALVFLRVPNMAAYDRVAAQISSSPEFRTPAVKCETLSSGIASYMDSYKDLLFGLRWMLVPSLLVTISLVIANAISISVRERRVEMAVLKVLGFSPNQILLLVLSEALLIGCLSGVASAAATWLLVNKLMDGLPLFMGFFSKFFIADAAPWWGLAIGAGTAFIGSLVPAWSARSVKVSEVFSKVA